MILSRLLAILLDYFGLLGLIVLRVHKKAGENLPRPDI